MVSNKNADSARKPQDDLKRILAILEDRSVARQVVTK